MKSKEGVDFDVPLRGTSWGTSKSTPTLLFMIVEKCEVSIISFKNMWIA